MRESILQGGQWRSPRDGGGRLALESPPATLEFDPSALRARTRLPKLEKGKWTDSVPGQGLHALLLLGGRRLALEQLKQGWPVSMDQERSRRPLADRVVRSRRTPPPGQPPGTSPPSPTPNSLASFLLSPSLPLWVRPADPSSPPFLSRSKSTSSSSLESRTSRTSLAR